LDGVKMYKIYSHTIKVSMTMEDYGFHVCYATK
jgi:hypothetical protein